MKMFTNTLTNAVEILANWKFIGKKTNPKLRALDYGMLEIAMMVSALDGAITSDEIASFDKLFRKCRGYSEKNSKLVFNRAIRKAGYMMALATTGIYSADDRVKAFVDEAVQSLPSGFFDGSLEDMRRAFVMWITMAAADGDFSEVERKSIEALRKRFAEIKVTRANDAALAWAAAYPGGTQLDAQLVQKTLNRTVKVLGDDFVARVEALLEDLNSESKREKAEAELSVLIKNG